LGHGSVSTFFCVVLSCPVQVETLRRTNPPSKESYQMSNYESVSKSFRNGRLERELQMVQLSASRCNCIAILWISLLSFAAIALCVVYFVVTQSGNFWIHSRRFISSRS
jgi:hypothetical protein